jgi:hypothetical protein
VPTTGKEADLCDRFGVVFVCMEEFLRDEILDVAALAGKLDVEICRKLALQLRSASKVQSSNIPLGTCIYVLPW